MSDNINVVPSTATNAVTIAMDECPVNGVNVKVQRVKVGLGVDGTYSDLREGQQFSACSMPVALSYEDRLHGSASRLYALSATACGPYLMNYLGVELAVHAIAISTYNNTITACVYWDYLWQAPKLWQGSVPPNATLLMIPSKTNASELISACTPGIAGYTASVIAQPWLGTGAGTYNMSIDVSASESNAASSMALVRYHW